MGFKLNACNSFIILPHDVSLSVSFLGIHIIMFEKIFISFWKTILLTSILVVAFSIVFYMQFYMPGLTFEVSLYFSILV